MKVASNPVTRFLADFSAHVRGAPLPSETPKLTDEECRALAWFERECEAEIDAAYIQRKQGRWVLRVPRYDLTMFTGDHLPQPRQLVLHAYHTVLNT